MEGMDTAPIGIPGCLEIPLIRLRDSRGEFIKTYNVDVFEAKHLQINWAEDYYTVSREGVARGLHFQLPPYEHEKLVYCISGRVFDAFVDLRKGSPTYQCHQTLELSSEKANMLYLPSGIAHGFHTMSSKATLVYKVSTVYSPKFDSGVRWDSAGIDWPDENPLVSERDEGLPLLNEFESPFQYRGCD